MRYLRFKYLILLISLLITFLVEADELEDNVRSMAVELEQKYPGTIKVKVAILQFRTSDNELTRFNQYLQDQFYNNYKNSERFEVIDQVTINRLIESLNWNLSTSSSFEIYNELSMQIFRNLNVIPDAFIYGLIEDNTQTISITSYILPNGVKSNIFSVVKISSNEFTDKLLGKETIMQSEMYFLPARKGRFETTHLHHDKWNLVCFLYRKKDIYLSLA